MSITAVSPYDLLGVTEKATRREVDEAYERSLEWLAIERLALYSLISSAQIENRGRQLEMAYRAIVRRMTRQATQVRTVVTLNERQSQAVSSPLIDSQGRRQGAAPRVEAIAMVEVVAGSKAIVGRGEPK